ncbi:type I glyceraldehyde-3-phosphate dehydrogenase [Patescibacteria group bacterium]|nr:type I glyceraldehyde-3-phosphate dehydrogenase [Patescibacteria group bacterium]MDE1946494.1 type I glyceraldehyde-3-phosphate dehydrogenase [Patescibacteria group bacterium]MDE2011261.1 type I glyceraldehyde-3-phosphate dehydrogenase [Patescibacteria group bacterium]MDE2233344.1 type I glyceraldehyde-3-phosphate dehydrogenase [Patescibacteria group bacterium]
MKKIRVAINGFGRIGRAFLKVARERQELEVVAVNDLGKIDNFAYLLKYDTAYGVSPFEVSVNEKNNSMVVDGQEVLFLSEKDPTKLPWKKLDIDVVVESTGLFTSAEKSQVHLDAGAKRVVISAPINDAPDAALKGETILMAMNEDKLESCKVSSNASCTTNASSPIIAIMDETIGIEKAILNTVHAYTASQALVDGPSKKDLREGRAAAMNMVPSSTGAAIAVTKVATQLSGKFDGISIRVPVVTGSIADVTFIAKRNTTVEEVNSILKKAAAEPRWNGIFTVTEEPLVSHDIVGNRHASIADLEMTRVVDGNLVKVLGWYDNEMGYTHTLVRHVIAAGRLI